MGVNPMRWSDLERQLIKADLRWVKLFEHIGVPDVTEDEVDEVLDTK
jgi:hypothetical protein